MKKDNPIKKHFQRWRLHPHINFLLRLHCSNCLCVGVQANLYCNMVRELQKYSTIMGFWSCVQYCGCDGVVGSYPLDYQSTRAVLKTKSCAWMCLGPRLWGPSNIEQYRTAYNILSEFNRKGTFSGYEIIWYCILVL